MNKPGYKILLLSVLCIGLITSCSKSKTEVRILLPVEEQLLGTWYVSKQVDTQLYYLYNNILSTDTSKTYYKTYTNFTAVNKISFKSGGFKDPAASIGNLGLQCIDYSYGLSSAVGHALPTGAKDSTYWFYDNDLGQVVIGGIGYYIMRQNTDTLILEYTTQTVAGLTTFNINWCYLHR